MYFYPGERLWRAGAPVDKAFLLVSGSASFVPKRRNAGSAGVPSFVRSYSVSVFDAYDLVYATLSREAHARLVSFG